MAVVAYVVLTFGLGILVFFLQPHYLVTVALLAALIL